MSLTAGLSGATASVTGMALMQELTNQGRVVGGHLTNGTISAAKNDLVIQMAFKRQRLNSETVREWEEIRTEGGVGGAVGQAVARAALPGRVGKAVGSGLGAAMHSGHTIRVDWVDDKQSLIELPEKLFMVLSVLLSDRRRITETPPEGATPAAAAPAGMTEQLMGLASSFMSRGRQEAAAPPPPPSAAQPDVAEQLTKLATLHDQGILTDEEFTTKKAELLKRL